MPTIQLILQANTVTPIYPYTLANYVRITNNTQSQPIQYTLDGSDPPNSPTTETIPATGVYLLTDDLPVPLILKLYSTATQYITVEYGLNTANRALPTNVVTSTAHYDGDDGRQNVVLGSNPSLTSSAYNNTSIGINAARSLTNGSSNTACGRYALGNATTAGSNTAVGRDAGSNIVNSGPNTFIGAFSNLSGTDTGTTQYNTAIGYSTTITNNAQGCVVIGTDHTGTGASVPATGFDQIVLGTSNHKVQIPNATTGTGTATLGANCPATVTASPYTWFRMMAPDGSTVYVPAWK